MTPHPPPSETIAAIATPTGQGGIGIIKLSGSGTRRIRDTLFRPSRNDAKTDSHRLIHGLIVDPDDGLPVDEVLVSWMAAPRSYTGEDVVEINTHGGIVIVRRILALCIANGARMAEPGEFTKRAFLNGRIDLTQAEAVIEVIAARTDRAARMASRNLNGELRVRTEAVRTALKDVYAVVAAGIDFPDDIDPEDETPQKLINRLRQDVVSPVEKLIEHQAVGRVLREGARIAVVGRPNVGKSSLMNRLLDRDRVIVSELPGTTRDMVMDVTSLDGIPITLVDTAGIRKTNDPIEAMGMQKSREAFQKAHLVLFLVEAGSEFHRDDLDLLDALNGMNVILVRNKMDLTDNHRRPTATGMGRELPELAISAKYGNGLKRLKGMITAQLTQEDDSGGIDDVMPNARQTHHLGEALAAVSRSIDLLASGGEDDLVALELGSAVTSINMVLGISAPVDILDAVFSRFCIGK